MILKFTRLHSNAQIPSYAHTGDAGFDLCTPDFIEIEAGERKRIPIGLSLEVPDGYVGLVWDKSGLADRFGIHGLAGVVDSGYRGEISVVLLNTGDTPVSFDAGQKIAQMLIQKVEQVEFEEGALSSSDRGEGGFGSTGV